VLIEKFFLKVFKYWVFRIRVSKRPWIAVNKKLQVFFITSDSWTNQGLSCLNS